MKVGGTSSVAGGWVGTWFGSAGSGVTEAPTGSNCIVANIVSSPGESVRVGVRLGSGVILGVSVSVGSGVSVGGIVIDGVNVAVAVAVGVSVGISGIGVT